MTTAQKISNTNPHTMSKTAVRKPTAPTRRTGVADKEQPLVDDIRLLGRILGDVIREQEGKAMFELIELIRQLDESLSGGGSKHSPQTHGWLDGVKQFFDKIGL